MIGEFDVVGGDEARIGYYVGIMVRNLRSKCECVASKCPIQVSIFFATEAITVLYWSRLSDRVGRKPVLLVGLFGVTLSMILVGMSRSFWVLVFSRSLCGALNGNTGVAKSALGEITDNTNVAQGIIDPWANLAGAHETANIAFALFPLVWSLGTMIAYVVLSLAQR
jgi:MFS family permease